MSAAAALDLWANDVSGQKRVRITKVSPDAAIADLLAEVVPLMGLVTSDALGRAVTWRARLEREGRHLHASELVGDALRADDEITVAPHVLAG